MELPPMGLYIHLPWCERKCPYCDFNSHEAKDIPEDDYVRALLHDLRHEQPLLQQRRVETLFIGGGTPSLFSVSSIHRLLEGIADLVELSPTLEATMEANPGSAEADKFIAFRDAGINRLSIGVQSFSNAQLQTLGRVHTSDQARAAIEFAHRANFDSINLDLMHGLPGQTANDAQSDLESAIAFGTTHLSWYQLTIEPNTTFYKRPPALPDEDELADIQQSGEELLAAGGYTQYEVSAYSKPGFPCRHNLNYWSFGDYLGIGAGAHGKVTLPDGRIQRYAKRRQPQDYLSALPGGHVASTRVVEPTELAGEFMLNALRLNAGFTLRQFESRTQLDRAQLEPQLGSLCQRQLLMRQGDTIRATETGRRFLDSVVGEFFPE
jgi:putative oxygen-independent coproporphyrinogen III oxidase